MTQRAIDGPYMYFVTTNTTLRSWFFDSPDRALALAMMIPAVATERGFDLFGFCILPDHVHMLVKKNGEFTLSKFMNDLKGRYSFRQQSGRLWQPRYNFRIIEDEERLANTVTYMRYNFQKHGYDEQYGRAPFVFLDWEKIGEAC